MFLYNTLFFSNVIYIEGLNIIFIRNMNVYKFKYDNIVNSIENNGIELSGNNFYIFTKLLKNICLFNVGRYRIVGRGYKSWHFANILFLKLGYAHPIYKCLDITLRTFKRMKKERRIRFWKIGGVSASSMNSVIKNIESLKLPNVYTKKGVFSYGNKINFKEGKKAYSL
jgi:hypothetical protein